MNQGVDNPQLILISYEISRFDLQKVLFFLSPRFIIEAGNVLQNPTIILKVVSLLVLDEDIYNFG